MLLEYCMFDGDDVDVDDDVDGREKGSTGLKRGGMKGRVTWRGRHPLCYFVSIIVLWAK